MSSIQTTQRSIDEPTRKVHLNIPQLLYWLIQARISIVIWGRATGKTDGPSALFTAQVMDNMPRCVIRIAAYTYEGLMKNILPGIIKGWEQKFGYVEGLHFWIGKEPPASLNIPKPYRQPRGDPKHMIYWYTGAVALLSSMDRTLNNGTEYEAILVEETRLCDEGRVKELILAKRGNRDIFGKSPYYGAVLMVTDRPKSVDQRWILNYQEQATPEINSGIMKAWKRIGQLEAKIQEQLDKGHKSAAEKTQRLITRLTHERDELRKVALLFSEASTLDNVHALGVSTIKDFIELLDEWDYNISVLNIDQNKVSDGFYALLGNHHFHDGTNYHAWEELGYDTTSKKTCLADSDCDLDQPLNIAFDVNAAINNVVTGQTKGKTLYVTNHQFVKAPLYLDELCKEWCAYYEPHHRKDVTFHYDHTLVGTDSQGKTPDYQLVTQILQSFGWNVTNNYVGQAPKHSDLYGIWKKTLAGHKGHYRVSFNATNCTYLRVSMENTDIKYYNGSIKKDKSSERKDYEKQTFKVPPEYATHAGEAMDTLNIGVQSRTGRARTTDTADPFLG